MKCWSLLFIVMLTLSFPAWAKLTWLNDQDLDFDIYDLRLAPNMVLYESADVYYHQDTILLPFYTVTNMLEVNLNYGPNEGLITGKINGQNVKLDLRNDDRGPNQFAVAVGQELYLDLNTLGQLLDAQIRVITRDLAIEFVATEGLFPIQKRLQRSQKVSPKYQPSGEPTYDFLIEDQYRLYTPPKGHVALSARKNRLDEQLNINVQTYNDLLYHAAHLSLANHSDDNITARFNMKRSQVAPDKKILGVLNHYAFGDVSASNTRLQTGYSGLGLVFGSEQQKYSSYFGKINIEEDAPAGWQAELYKNGFLLETTTVQADGRVVFQNIDTAYGNNRFQIKLYGPYGEEQTIDREVLVGHNMLKPNQFNFTGGIIDTGQRLFNNGQDTVSSPAAFIQTEYGLNAKTSLGFSYFVQHNQDDSPLNEAIFSVTRQLPNALADLNFFIQEQDKYKVDLNLLGTLGTSVRYSAGAFSNKNYDNRDAAAPLGEQTGYRGGITARLGAFGLGLNGYSKANKFEIDGVFGESQFDDLNLIISSRFKQFNITNTLNYNYNSQLNSNAQLTDRLAISSPIGDRWYLRTSANFLIANNDDEKTELDSIDINATWRAPANIYASFNGQYHIDDRYRLSTNVSVRQRKYNLIFGTSYSSESKWQLSAGITFNIDYDYHNGRVNLQSEYSAASSTLDLMTFIDNNQNAQYDEYDEPLPGVQFGVKPYWRDIRSNQQGLTYLPGLGHNAPIKVYFNTMETKSSTLKPVNDNFRFYTHAGGVTSLDVPFNYAVTVDGLITDKTLGQNAKFVPLQLLDSKGNMVKEALSDIENYYLLEDLWPGQYTLRVNPEFLTSKGLMSSPESLSLKITGSEPVLSLPEMIIEPATSDQDEPQLTSGRAEELQRGEFYSIQFGAYDDREYCQLRTTELKNVGVAKAFYSMQTQYCTVMAGEFAQRRHAYAYLRTIPKEVRDDAYVRVFSTIRTAFAVHIDSYTTLQDCQSYLLTEVLANTYVVNDDQKCDIYLGDFLTRELAEAAYRALPYAIRKGAKVVEL